MRLCALALATTVARSLGLCRQRVAYHVRQLETHGYVELVREEPRRGCIERIVRRKAHHHPDGRTVRVVVGAHPINTRKRKP